MTDRATSQADNVLPPRRGKVIAISVDSTARSYDLTAIALPDTYQSTNDWVYLTIATSVECWVIFHSATAATLDDTAAISAGSALALATTHGFPLREDSEHHFRINRAVDKFLQIKSASGTSGVLTLYASSENTKP